MSDEVTSNLRPQLLGRMTQRAVVEALKSKGPMSRADIARLTGISPTTVSSAVTQVVRTGLIEETDAEISGPGRPGKILRLASDAVQVLGVSIEPEFCKMMLGGIDGHPNFDSLVQFPTPHTYGRLLAEIERHARAWMQRPNTRILGIGLSLPGVIDSTGDLSVFSPNLHQIDDQQPSRDLRNRLGLTTVLIQENDALCLGERRVHQIDDLCVVDYTGGLGVGCLVGGRLIGQHIGLPRELGHITVVLNGEKCGCGNIGCLETVATDTTFARLVSAKVHKSLTVDEALAYAAEDPSRVRAELDFVLDYLAVAVAAVTNLFAPPLIAMHGKLLGLQPTLLAQLSERSGKRKLAPYRDRCRLVSAATTKAEGAIAGILDHLFEELGPILQPSVIAGHA
ncbi:ROK family transcriptional regulator [Limnoglobus roseus]|uniref:ROK family transcriptional regulator n=1 Tax=Limnoglobus roseus TaxID=2598579 RepID=A0A5C1AGA8_9BACT|nr:ROK family transcriptional regulator [Limnoglobus roseus]QEL17177.1 ROK family transcriptional regulator [Limnoglobus roseus]